MYILKNIKGQSLDDFTMTPGKQLKIKPVALYEQISVEACSSVCVFSEGILCRSFDFILSTRNCLLYDENAAKGSKLISNDDCNHYSSSNFSEL